eukprot:gene8378-10292_t
MKRINNIPSTTLPIHLELASIASESLLLQLFKQVIPFIDSIGLNEQELGYLYKATGGSNLKMSSFRDPDVNTVVTAINHLFDLITHKRQLTRIHFHCLSFHLIAVRVVDQHSITGISTQWWNTKSTSRSLAASSLEASERACGSKDLELKLPLQFKVDYLYTPGSTIDIKINPSHPVHHWQDNGLEFHIAPVLVCKRVEKTVGLGDSISSVSLIYQLSK